MEKASQDNIIKVVPGMTIGSSCDFKSGPGTFVRDGDVIASRVGFQVISKDIPGDFPVIEVRPKLTSNVSRAIAVEDVVIARILKITAFQATCQIVCLDGKALSDSHSGVIRKEDVRATEIDKVDMPQCFRPGDIVRAQVISLGDKRHYYLSTARDELGVVVAESTSGHKMIPLNWNEMQCPVSKVVEKRKVAKIEE